MKPYFVQIGLGPIAEFAELVKSGWCGALVEPDPLSFAHNRITLSSRKDLDLYFDNLDFFNVGITGKSGFNVFNSRTFGTNRSDRTATEFNVFSVSLDILLDYLPKSEVVAMDVEAMELQILRHYSFAHNIPCFRIECHGKAQQESVESIMKSNEYELIKTYSDQSNPNVVFGLKGVYNSSPASRLGIVSARRLARTLPYYNTSHHSHFRDRE